MGDAGRATKVPETATSWALLQRPKATASASGSMQMLALVVLAADADERHRGEYSRAAVATIANHMQVEASTAKRCLRALEAAGLIGVEVGGGRGNPNTYRLLKGVTVASLYPVRAAVKGGSNDPHSKRRSADGSTAGRKPEDRTRPATFYPKQERAAVGARSVAGAPGAADVPLEPGWTRRRAKKASKCVRCLQPVEVGGNGLHLGQIERQAELPAHGQQRVAAGVPELDARYQLAVRPGSVSIGCCRLIAPYKGMDERIAQRRGFRYRRFVAFLATCLLAFTFDRKCCALCSGHYLHGRNVML